MIPIRPSADLKRRIEAARAGRPVPPAKDSASDTFPDKPKGA